MIGKAVGIQALRACSASAGESLMQMHQWVIVLSIFGRRTLVAQQTGEESLESAKRIGGQDIMKFASSLTMRSNSS